MMTQQEILTGIFTLPVSEQREIVEKSKKTSVGKMNRAALMMMNLTAN